MFNYTQFLQETKREADDARRPLEDNWRKAWDIFHGRWDFSKKAGWQTKVGVPRYAQTVETAAAILKRAMMEARQTYAIEGESQEDKAKAPLLKKLIDLWLRLANFVVTFTDAVKLGGIVDIIPLKLTWPEWEEQVVVMEDPLLGGLGWEMPTRPTTKTVRRSGLRVELLDPFRVWLDPSGKNRYVIEESYTDLDELRKMVQLAPQSWDSVEVDRLSAGKSEEMRDYLERSRQGLAAAGDAPWRKPIKLTTYWGDVVDEMGKRLHADHTFAVANSTYLVGKPRPIPFWHVILDKRLPNKRGPIIWSSLFRVPLAVYGKGFGRDNLGLAKMLTDLACALGDENIFASINAFEVDKDLIDEPEQFKDGVYPGKTFTKIGSGGRALIEPRTLGTVNPQSLAIYAMYDRLYQNSTGVTDYVAAAQPIRQTPTLGEYQGRQSQALGLLDIIARNLEDSLLEPVLETVYWLILQYMDDFAAPPVVEALGPDAIALASLTDAERFGFLKAGVRFQARGMSIVLAKGEEVQKVAMFLQGLPPLLKAVPGLMQIINWEAIVRKVIEGFQWDTDEILRPPQQAGVERAAIENIAAPGMAPQVEPQMGPQMEPQMEPVVPQMGVV